jgi:hypothetical protein
MTVCLANLTTSTAQEVFDHVADHMLRQGVKSQNEWGNCLYRGPNGLMCAAGCLIGDDEYNPDMDSEEQNTWSSMIEREFAPETHHELISTLQLIHDSAPPEYWSKMLIEAATYRNLDPYIVTHSEHPVILP